MRIGGFQKLTLVDFPGLLAATVFTQGCNFRCGYCHNPELVLPEYFQAPLNPEMLLEYLYSRRNKIDGVVITGGEPTLQKGLIDFIVKIKAMGFKVKLDTNGSHPDVLRSLIELKLVDYWAMDVKTSLDKYGQLTIAACDTARIRESIRLIIDSGIPYQLRTTLVKGFCSQKDLGEIRLLIGEANNYVLQPFVRSVKMIDPALMDQEQYSSREFECLREEYEIKGVGPA